MTTKQLELQATQIREDIIKMLVAAGSGHSAGPLGMADVFTALYFDIMKHDPKNPTGPSGIDYFSPMVTLCRFAMPLWPEQVIFP
jgi:transketolase N-terminal domain/subunit